MRAQEPIDRGLDGGHWAGESESLRGDSKPLPRKIRDVEPSEAKALAPTRWTARWVFTAIVILAMAFTGGCERGQSSSSKPIEEQVGPMGDDIPEASSRTSSSAVPTGFRDVARESGLNFHMRFLPTEQGESFKINLYDHGCGLVVGDYDGDGDDDIYFLNQLGPNGLYRNRGEGTFEDVTAEAGVALDDRICVGGTFADFDNDGDQDLYVTSTRGGNVLFRNEGNGRFVDVTEPAGLSHVGHSQTATFFDFDRDGRLDLFLVQTSEWTTAELDADSRYYLGKGGGGNFEAVITAPREYNRLYRNEGEGRFHDVTEQSGLLGRGWAGDVAIFDYDEDGWLDVFVTSMFGRAQLYRNQRNGTFVDVTLDVLGKTPFGGIGARAFDANNDGRLDLYVVDMHSDMWMGLDLSQSSLDLATQSEKTRFDYFYGPKVEGDPALLRHEEELEDVLGFRHSEVVFGNAFYKALGGGKFVEQSGASNLETFWPWGVATGDFDNDGHEDVFLPTGMGYPFYYWHNYLLMNQGNETFVDRSFAAGIEPPVGGQFTRETIAGKPSARSSRCAATADFNGDGRLDLATNNFNHGPYYYRNEWPRANYLAVRLRGTRSNRDAIGAVVRIPLDDRTLTRQVHPAGGYLSQSSKTLHFGLGSRDSVERLEIVWPSGTRQIVEQPEINGLMEITEPESP